MPGLQLDTERKDGRRKKKKRGLGVEKKKKEKGGKQKREPVWPSGKALGW